MDGRVDSPGRIQFAEWGSDYAGPEPREDRMDDVIATERVYEKVPIPHSKRTRDLLRYRPGDRIPHDEAVRLGVIEETKPEPKSEPAEPEAPKVPASLQKAARTPRPAATKKAAAKSTRASKKS